MVMPVSRLLGPFRIGNLLHIGDFFVHPVDRRSPHRHQQVQRIVRRLGHGLFQPPVGVGRIAEQQGAFSAQAQDFRTDLLVVRGVVIVAAQDEQAPDFFAQVAPGRIGFERLHGRTRILHRILSGLAQGLRLGGQRGDEAVRQAGQVVLGQPRHLGFVVQQVLGEQVEMGGQFLVDRRDLGLVGLGELGAGADEVAIVQPQKALLLDGQGKFVLVFLVDIGRPRRGRTRPRSG